MTSSNRLGFTARPATIDKDGNFTITGVTPGRFRLTASVAGVPGSPEPGVQMPSGPIAPRWMVKSSIVNGRDTIDAPVEIRGGEHLTGAVVTLTDQVTELSGTILDAANKPVPDLTVIVFSTDRTFWTSASRRVRAPIRSIDGKFRLTALPPGEYYLAVVTDVHPSDWGDPAYMEQLAAAAIKITIAEGEKKVQDVRIGGV
jgi:hypothetical protein